MSLRLIFPLATKNSTSVNTTFFKKGCKLSGSPPPPESTCWQHSQPIYLDNITQVKYNQTGCDHVECEALVCACDPYCCETLWDLACRGYPDNRFKPGCSANQLCCEKQPYTTIKASGCNCYRKRLPIVEDPLN